MQITSDDGSVFRILNGSELWSWACDMDRDYEIGLVDWLELLGRMNGCPAKMTRWSRDMVDFAVEAAVEVFTRTDDDDPVGVEEAFPEEELDCVNAYWDAIARERGLS